MASARDELLGRVIEHAAAQGLSDCSLRELAEAVGTSHRMLLYHFGSRAGLVAAVVATVEAQQRDVLVELGAWATDPLGVLNEQWKILSAPDMAPFVRLFFEFVSQSMFDRPGTQGFLHALTTPWIDAGKAVAADLGVEVDEVDLRLGIAVMRGLLLDAVASGDATGPTAALERFVERWRSTASLGNDTAPPETR